MLQAFFHGIARCNQNILSVNLLGIEAHFKTQCLQIARDFIAVVANGDVFFDDIRNVDFQILRSDPAGNCISYNVVTGNACVNFRRKRNASGQIEIYREISSIRFALCPPFLS